MAVELVFERPALVGSPVNLVFGEDLPPVVQDADIAFVTTLPPVSGSVTLRVVKTISFISTLPAMSGYATLDYNSDTSRPTVGLTRARYEDALVFQTSKTGTWDDAVGNDTARKSHWQDARGLHDSTDAAWNDADRAIRNDIKGNYEDAINLGRSSVQGLFEDASRAVRQDINGRFERALRNGSAIQSLFEDGLRSIRNWNRGRYEDARPFLFGLVDDSTTALRLVRVQRPAYEDAMRPPPGLSDLTPPIPPGPEPCYTPNTELVFSALWSPDTGLVFSCNDIEPPPPEGEVVVPIRRVYIVANNILLRRASDNAPVIATSFSLSLDVDSWSWGFNASMPGSQLSLVEPTGAGPVELIAGVNGTDFRVLAESVSRERVFGQLGLRISGRGINARLDAPFAAIQTFTNINNRTAQQLMEDVLTLNGIPLGWEIIFQLEDWTVPAGVFNHQGSYITALTTIAKSAGGYLLPHPSLQRFTVKPRYPVAPWAWNTVVPNFTLPADVAVREGLQWIEKAEYERVFVSGQQSGVLGQVTRAGTAGELVAPMVVDPLITNAIAARQRGLSILADTGRQMRVGLKLPVLAETGIILPGAFVNYQDGGVSRLGIVRGVNVEVGFPEVWQNLEVETHL